MRRVLLVDDERLIREGLRTLIDWESLGWTVVGLAADGEEALAAQARLHADLVITDLKMPRMGGIDLLAELRRRGDPCRALVLTGFAEFEYAQQAAAHGIDGYLLKPVDEDELVTQLAEILKRLGASPVSVGAVLAGEAAPPADWDWGRWQVVLLGFPHRPEGPRADEEAAFARQVRQSGLGEPFARGAGLGVLLRQVYPGGRNLDRLARQLEGFLSPDLLPFQGAVGAVVTQAAEIPESAGRAGRLLGQAFFHPPSSLVAEDLPPGRSPLDPLVWIDKLSLATGFPDQVHTLVRDLFRDLALSSSEAVVKETLARIVGPVPWASELWRFSFLSALEAFVLSRLEDQASTLPAGGPGLADRITEVIETRYAEPLKLETLADAFGYNAAYLGKLYKAKTGESFNQALDRVRIRQAELLLAQGYKVYQVAELVGYRYVDYFHAKFKKLTGVTPSHYKP